MLNIFKKGQKISFNQYLYYIIVLVGDQIKKHNSVCFFAQSNKMLIRKHGITDFTMWCCNT